VEGINSRGDIIGWYFDCVSGSGHNFVLTNGGAFTVIDPPGCFGDAAFLAKEMGINEAGDVVGTCLDNNFGMHGFLLSKGAYTIVDAPGAAQGTAASGINPKGDIVGWFIDSSGNAHGFLLSKGNYSIIDVPAPPPQETQAQDINPQGDILGTYQDQTSGSANTGFLLSRGGVFSTFQIPPRCNCHVPKRDESSGRYSRIRMLQRRRPVCFSAKPWHCDPLQCTFP
jgi:probable HAF family extracellular repeat protein